MDWYSALSLLYGISFGRFSHSKNMVSQDTVKGDGIFSPSLLSVYRYAYMTGFSVTIVGISLCPDSALSLSESVIRSYINIVTFPNANPVNIQQVMIWAMISCPWFHLRSPLYLGLYLRLPLHFLCRCLFWVYVLIWNCLWFHLKVILDMLPVFRYMEVSVLEQI